VINNEEEIWKSHPDIVGIEVSTLGRVRTLDRITSNGRGTYSVKGRVLKQWDNGNGYLHVNLRMNGKKVNKKVHRLVAETFIPNPDNLPQVNHLDCDRTNNNVENLEWCTASYNIKYREKFGEAQGHPLFAINLTTLKVSRYPSQIEASRELRVGQGNINAVIEGRLKQIGGYWFTNDDNNAADTIKQKLYEIKHQSTLKGEVSSMQKHANEDIRAMSFRVPYRLIAEKLGVTTGTFMNMLIKPLKKEKHDQIVEIIEEIKGEMK